MSAANEHFDAVVVGSGFGGSVVSYRLAEAGMRVCLLERGKAYPPGSFPRNPAGMRTNFWDPSDGLFGMYSVWSFDHFNALVSSGLGGGSLIYANVLLRKDEKWFEEDGWKWPVNRATLDPHYDVVEKMMKVQRYPIEKSPYDTTWKTLTMKRLANDLGLQFDTPPLAVTFANQGHPPIPGQKIIEAHPNYHNADRYTCLLVGECDVGCNFGSKNSLDYTYISAAKRVGADIRILSEVKAFRPRPNGGYEVAYAKHDPRNKGRAGTEKQILTIITADRLILSAGTLGSTYLLLRNQKSFPAFAPNQLGHKFCGNGDLIGFFLKCTDPKTAVRFNVNPSHAPVITSYARASDTLDDPSVKRRGFYIEDAGHPEFVNWLVDATQIPNRLRAALQFLWWRIKANFSKERRTDISKQISALFGDCDFASSSFAILGMGRDTPDGNFSLSRGRILECDWKLDHSDPYFDTLRATMIAMAQKITAEFHDNPIRFLRRVVTVHPLGGCPMGHSPHDGFVDSYGKVFGYENLYIADGSVMPGPVGANPSLTIAAMADRTADHIIENWRRS